MLAATILNVLGANHSPHNQVNVHLPLFWHGKIDQVFFDTFFAHVDIPITFTFLVGLGINCR